MFNTTLNRLGVYRGSGVWDVYTIKADFSATSPLLYNSSTGVISSQAASGSQNGYLLSTDWSVFNNKQNALNGTGYAKQSGTTTSYLSRTSVLSDIGAIAMSDSIRINPKLNLSTSNTISYFGDSYTANQGSTDTNRSFKHIVTNRFNKTFKSYAISGKATVVAAYQGNQYLQVNQKTSVLAFTVIDCKRVIKNRSTGE
jgi:hypothetical protein